MRAAYEEDEDEISRHSEDDREVTLSSTTVLLIFFGLVLVCGLCFGLGYTLGHRSTPEGAISAPIQAQPPLVASTSGAKPSAASSVTPAPVSDSPTDASANAETPAADEPAPLKVTTHEAAPEPASTHKPPTATTEPVKAPLPPQIKPALVQTAPAATSQAHPTAISTATPAAPAHTTAATSGMTSAPTSSGIMVQVAAISNANDAQVLVGALRKRGYAASVHSQASDNLLRVQVGPFASRAEAAAMKQKLLSDGYNAILK